MRTTLYKSPLGSGSVFLVVFFLSSFAKAQPCEFKSAEQLFSQIRQHHPQIEIADKRSQISLADRDLAAQRPNPVLNFNTHYGRLNGFRSTESNLSLQHVFELGNKRKARLDYAESGKNLSDLQILNQVESVLIDSALHILRLAQVESLLELYEESIEAFKRTRDTRQRNKRLSPEQKIEEDILGIEVGKHRLRIGRLKAEKNQLLRLLQLYAGQNCQIEFSQPRFDFSPPESFNEKSLQMPEYRLLRADAALSESKFQLEKSAAYPDLKIGPSFQWEEEEGQRVDRYGIALSTDLPILNWNSGGKAKAQAEYQVSVTRAQLFENENQAVMSSKITTYRELLKALEETPSKQDLLEKHHRIERFFLRGLISVSSMLEGHDQLLEAIEDRDQTELLTLQLLLELEQARGNLDPYLSQWSQK